MPTNTSKFNLVKPLKSEKYNVDVFNGNADIIDSQIYSKTEVDTALNGKANSVHTHVKTDITDFAHTHPISEVVGLQTALNGKANTTTTVNNQPLSSNIIINASGVPNTPAGNISATNVQTALNELDAEKVDKLMATNLVTNGDFSNGTTGWVGNLGTISNVNNELNILANANIGGATQNNISLISGNRYYFSGALRGQSTFSARLTIDNQVSPFQNFGIIDFTLSTTFQLKSQIVTPNLTISTGAIRIRDMRSSGFDTFYADNILLINLTQLFGAGNEPTRAQMDMLLSVYPNSWFNGTSEIGSIGALIRATLGVQVVTPTLLNSRTGTAQYVVSNDGLVIFRGTASGGSLNTNIFVLPENIRPIATRVFPISANNAFGVVTVAENGEVRQTVGALTNVFLDGIVFKVGV